MSCAQHPQPDDETNQQQRPTVAKLLADMEETDRQIAELADAHYARKHKLNRITFRAHVTLTLICYALVMLYYFVWTAMTWVSWVGFGFWTVFAPTIIYFDIRHYRGQQIKIMNREAENSRKEQAHQARIKEILGYLDDDRGSMSCGGLIALAATVAVLVVIAYLALNGVIGGHGTSP